MPLEMFAGKSGPSLIALLPVTDGSYAEVETRSAKIRVVHPKGLVVNNSPALVPLEDTLPADVTNTVRTQRDALRLNILDAFANSVGGSRSAQERDKLLADIDKPIICPGIALGRVLDLKLPRSLFEDKTSVSLGIITSITIYNQGEAPVFVRS